VVVDRKETEEGGAGAGKRKPWQQNARLPCNQGQPRHTTEHLVCEVGLAGWPDSRCENHMICAYVNGW
jgi:hypothetical protein